MNYRECEQEKIVLQAVHANHFDEETRSHIAACASCQETLSVVKMMRALAKVSEPPALPAAGLIRWKAQLIEKQLITERATHSILITQTVGAMVCITALFGWFIWRWPLITIQLSGLKHEWQRFFAQENLLLLSLLLALCLSVICLAMIFTLRVFLKRDFRSGAY
jgi:hypothetical protein